MLTHLQESWALVFNSGCTSGCVVHNIWWLCWSSCML